MLAAHDAAADEFGSLKHAHVLGRGGESHAERGGEFAEVAFAVRSGHRELTDDCAAGGMGQSLEDEV